MYIRSKAEFVNQVKLILIEVNQSIEGRKEMNSPKGSENRMKNVIEQEGECNEIDVLIEWQLFWSHGS